MSAYSDHHLALRSDGTAVAWGGNRYGQSFTPAVNHGFVAVAAGNEHSLGLKSDGSVVAWGLSTNGQCNVPAPNTDFVAVAAFNHNSYGLKADGSLAAWGHDVYDQSAVPQPNARFLHVAGGAYHCLAVRGAPVSTIGDRDDAAGGVPLAAAISDLAPNPFNPRTTVRIDLPRTGAVVLAVHDLRGRRVRELWRGMLRAGQHTMSWDGLDERGHAAPSGVYLVQLTVPDGSRHTVKATLAR